MNAAKRAALERAGFRIGDAKDFLGLSDEENAIVELRVRIAQAVRRLREINGISQNQLAERMNSSQSRVAKIETASLGTSLDLLFRGFIAAGGKLDPGALLGTKLTVAAKAKRPSPRRRKVSTRRPSRASA
jgi:hypothetical protein